MVEKLALEAPIIDAHGHTLDLAFQTQRHLHHALGGLTDVPLLRTGGFAAQLTACWVPDAAIGGPHASHQPLQLTLQILDYLHCELAGEAGEYAVLATTADAIEKARAQGKIAFIVGMEGGDALKGDPTLLRTLYRLGVRHLGLVHEGRNALGCATQVWEGSHMRLYDRRNDAPGRLTAMGAEILREMNRLGMLVDLTHMVEDCFWEALEIARGPVSATHGNARSLRDTERYLSDEQIRAIAATGGIICPSPTPLGPAGEKPSLEMLLDHIDYMVDLVGADYVGFGTDFLGQSENPPTGFRDLGECHHLSSGLQRRGHGTAAISKILGGNFMRVFRTVAG